MKESVTVAYNPILLYFSAFLIPAFKSFFKSIFRRVKSQTDKGGKWPILVYAIEMVIRFRCEVHEVYNVLLRWDKYILLANNFLYKVCKCIWNNYIEKAKKITHITELL